MFLYSKIMLYICGMITSKLRMADQEKNDRLTLQEAFEKVIAQPMWWVNIKDDAKKATYFKQAYKDGRVSEAKMREVLRKAGYAVVQQEMWGEKVAN
jgi:hypothetical protein